VPQAVAVRSPLMPTTLNTLSFFVHRTRQIYTLPAVALEVLELTSHPRVDCRKLKECIEHDPALVAKILRVVNSSLFGINREVCDLNQALALLGIKPLKLLVLGFSLSEAIFQGKTGEAMQHAWRHTLTRAVAARELCEAVWRVRGDEAFTAGLLAGLGKFALLDELGDAYATVLATSPTSASSLIQLEQAALGFDHSELSAELLSHWNLPSTLVDAVRHSTRPDQCAKLGRPDNLLPNAVRMGGLIADLVVDGKHFCLPELIGDRSEQDSGEFDRFQLTDESLKQLVERVNERVADLATALSFELPPGQDYRDVLVAAYDRLSLLATEASCAVARQWPLIEDHGADVAGLSTALACYVNRFSDSAESAGARRRSTKRDKHEGTSTQDNPPRKPSLRSDSGDSRKPARPSTRSATPPTREPSAEARLLDRLATVVGLCRQARCPLSLVLVELDRFKEIASLQTPAEISHVLARLEASTSSIDHPGAVCTRLNDSRLALVVADCDRSAAVALGQQILRGICPAPGADLAATGTPTLSVGVSTVTMASKNFPPAELLTAATRCLDAAKLSGGNTLKSIDAY
jgi:HD-like signal output (HDOD) protein/GGDEF domain-containing protein